MIHPSRGGRVIVFSGKRIFLATSRLRRFLGFFLPAVLVMCVVQVSGLDPRKALSQYAVESWLSDNGLPQNSVSSILQSRDGYLWLGTQEGLVRFDGVKFTIFDKNNTEAITSNYIQQGIEDREGVLWFGTVGGGMIRYKDKAFTSYTTKDGLSNNFITSICKDRLGAIWIGMNGGGLAKLEDGRFTQPPANQALPNNVVRAILEDRAGNLWVGTEGGLARIKDGIVKSFGIEDGLPSPVIYCLLEDPIGDIWIGTYGGGLSRYRDGVFKNFSEKDGLKHNQVSSLFKDRDGSLWIGTHGGGLHRMRDEKIESISTKNGFPHDFIISLYEDREGNLWVGTVGRGLIRLMDPKFATYGVREGLPGNDIRSVYEDKDGAIWIGMFGGGLARMKDGKITAYAMKDGLPAMDVRSVRGDSRGNIWIGSFGSGLTLLQKGRFATFSAKDGLPNDFVMAIEEDSNGNIWIGTNGGIAIWQNGRFKTYTRKNGLQSEMIRAITACRDGGVWVGAYNGLNKIVGEAITNWSVKDGLTQNLIVSLYEDADGVLWVGTYGGGLCRFKEGKFTAYSVKEGFFDNVVFEILEDKNGLLWMSSNKGICSVAKKDLNDFADGKITSYRCRAYDRSDGMRSSECTGGGQPSGWKTQDGRILIPSIGGLVVIDPDNLKNNDLPPPVVIEELSIDGRYADLKTAAEIRPGTKKFEVHYTALSLVAPEKVRFRYHLEGFDKEWTDAGNRRVAFYTNIPPKRYVFRVQASNNDGVWNEEGDFFEFSLKPRFYQSIFFLVLVGIGAVLVIWGLLRLRTRQMRVRQRQLAQLVEERTRELSQIREKLERSDRDLKAATQELEILSLTDRLTNLANRRKFEQTLEAEWARCRRECKTLSLVLADLDFFKSYNDAFGPQQGDECLKRVGRIMKELIFRPGDLVARYGGEEFIIVLPNTDVNGACNVAERIRVGLEEQGIPHPGSKVSRSVTISAGVAAIIPDRLSSSGVLIGLADRALYQAKHNGRNRVECLIG